MNKEAQLKLMHNILSINKNCHTRVGVWGPTVAEIKHLLNMGHIRLDANSDKPSNTIFSIHHEHIGTTGFSAVEVVLFCNEPEAKFMRKYLKKKGGDKK